MVKCEKKACSKCKVVKPIDAFGTYKRPTASGEIERVRSWCKDCAKEASAAWKKANPEKYNAQQRARRERKKQGIKRKPQTHEEMMAKKVKYNRERRQRDPAYRMMTNLRGRLRHALKGKSKSARTQALLGCTPEECLAHIEAQFTEGMTWQNIDVDHIVPCASFNLENPEEQRQCFHWSNLQPLFKPDNRSKGAKITERAAHREWTGTMWVDKVLTN